MRRSFRPSIKNHLNFFIEVRSFRFESLNKRVFLRYLGVKVKMTLFIWSLYLIRFLTPPYFMSILCCKSVVNLSLKPCFYLIFKTAFYIIIGRFLIKRIKIELLKLFYTAVCDSNFVSLSQSELNSSLQSDFSHLWICEGHWFF